MVVLAGANEQSGANLTAFPSGTTLSREYPEINSYKRAIFFLDVTAVSGTSPTLDASIEFRDPISLKWHTLFAFPQQIAVTATVITPVTAEIYARYYRAKFVVGGTATPTVTCSLACVASSEEPIR